MSVLCSCGSQRVKDSNAVAAPDLEIKPTDSRIAYVGRTQIEGESVTFDWAGVEVRFAINGNRFTLLMDGGNSDYNIVVDNKVLEVLRPQAGELEHVIDIPTAASNGKHLVVIKKRNDGNYGVARFNGLKLPAGSQLLAKPVVEARKIEFIGDSYTVGYGNEGASTQCDSLRPYENNGLSYATITARALNAQVHISAISGRGLVRNYGDKNQTSEEPMPILYSRALFSDAQSIWDFSQWQPDAVVVKLGTNDFSTQPHPDHAVFKQALTDLLTRVSHNYGDVPIFIITDASLPVVVELYRDFTQQENSLPNAIHLVELPKPTMEQLGCDWHPNVNYHQQAATILAPVIKRQLGW